MVMLSRSSLLPNRRGPLSSFPVPPTTTTSSSSAVAFRPPPPSASPLSDHIDEDATVDDQEEGLKGQQWIKQSDSTMATADLDFSDRYYNNSTTSTTITTATATATAAVNVVVPDRLFVSEHYDYRRRCSSSINEEEEEEYGEEHREGGEERHHDSFGDGDTPRKKIASATPAPAPAPGSFLSQSERYEPDDSYGSSENAFVYRPRVVSSSSSARRRRSAPTIPTMITTVPQTEAGTSSATASLKRSGKRVQLANSSSSVILTTTTTAAAASQRRRSSSQRRVVQFHHDLHIREYPIILGDNPACLQGPPVRCLCVLFSVSIVSMLFLYTQPLFFPPSNFNF